MTDDRNTAGGPLDIQDKHVYRNETDAELHGQDDITLDPDDLPDADAVKAGLRFGRDSYVVKSDVDPEEDNYAPGIREQD